MRLNITDLCKKYHKFMLLMLLQGKHKLSAAKHHLLEYLKIIRIRNETDKFLCRCGDEKKKLSLSLPHISLAQDA